MDGLPLDELVSERELHFGVDRVPPIPATTAALIEYLHTLNALRLHLVNHIDAILQGASDCLSELEEAELEAVRAGADALEAQKRWQLISINWRRWALDTTGPGARKSVAGAKLAAELLSPDSLCATGFGQHQLDILALFEEAYRDELDPRPHPGSSVKLAALWQMTRDWADRILAYAQALDRLRKQFDRAGEASPAPAPPRPTSASPPHTRQTGRRTKPTHVPAPKQARNTAKLVKASDLPVPRLPASSPRPATQAPGATDPPPPAATLPAEHDLVFVETQNVPAFHLPPSAPAAAAPKARSSHPPSPGLSPVAEQDGRAEQEASVASDFDMLESSVEDLSAGIVRGSLAGKKAKASDGLPKRVVGAAGARSPAFVSSPAGGEMRGGRAKKRGASPGLAPPAQVGTARRASPRLRSVSPAPVAQQRPAARQGARALKTKAQKQSAEQAFAALNRDFGPAGDAQTAAEPTQASSEIVGESYETQSWGAGFATQAAPFTQAAFSDPPELETQLPRTQAPPAANGSSQSHTQSSGLTYASIPEDVLRQAEQDALTGVGAATAGAGAGHGYLQAPAAWAGYGGETQMPFTQGMEAGLFEKVVREATSSFDGEGAEEFVAFTQQEVA